MPVAPATETNACVPEFATLNVTAGEMLVPILLELIFNDVVTAALLLMAKNCPAADDTTFPLKVLLVTDRLATGARLFTPTMAPVEVELVFDENVLLLIDTVPGTAVVLI